MEQMDQERRVLSVTKEQLEEVAEMAAERVFEKATYHFYAQIGKGVVDKFLVVVGMGIVALYMYFSSKPNG